MSSVASLREHLVEELNDLLNAEQQLIEALPEMSKLATSRELKTAFRNHLAETRTHERRVAQALRQLGEEPDGKTCEAMEGLLAEGQELMDATDGGALRDAMMITAAQKVEHYEIATYGTVRTYARVLGERGVANLMSQTLKEEKAADKKLTSIAEGSVNGRASVEWHEKSDATDLMQEGAKWVGGAVGSAVKTVRGVLPTTRTVNRAAKQVRSAMPSMPSMPTAATARRAMKTVRGAMPAIASDRRTATKRARKTARKK